jgi:hypothetical protein
MSSLTLYAHVNLRAARPDVHFETATNEAKTPL